ncbi:hypothetical protein MOQ_000080 [Trypanosoma cruzi marinkellei]|uniref:C3H1-type domain-containing protein n=1 Tax=Trypanosoma cruzi marinkellei TaxID=85056 RepID=K2MWT4_TRYCR|nr:hypothetical protein MOQ_000080 [Trypanosoma cruzi marinkellei]
MQLLAPLIEAKEGYTYDADGRLCMVVVDPATRKLLIPCNCIYATRAQQRSTIPSLCQLFLHGRCRQGVQCHQVHASLDAVVALRSRVGNLPCCCVFHGDEDIADVLNERSWLSKVVLYVPEVSFEGGYIPLSRVGYTVPISKILNEVSHEIASSLESYTEAIREGRVPHEEPPVVVLEAGDIPICRLHIRERCRFAEECSFLHLCKDIAGGDPELPLGRRSRLKATPSESDCVVSESHDSTMSHAASLSPAAGVSAGSNACPISVRGFPLVQRVGASVYRLSTNTLCVNGGKSPWMSHMHASGSIDQDLDSSTMEASTCLTPVPKFRSLGWSDIHPLNRRSVVCKKSSSRVLVSCESLLHCEGDPEAAEEGTPEFRNGDLMEGCRKAFSVRGTTSNSMAASSRDEGTSTSSMSLSTSHRCCAGGKWRHDPYNLSRSQMGC